MGTRSDLLDRVFEPVVDALTPEVARRLIGMRAEPQLQQRIDYLADRSTEGVLTPDERDEYEALVAAGDFMAILQAQARTVLARSSAA